MNIPIYQVDAFSSKPFSGNPAAVCVLDEWLPDETMQNIAAENNYSETAFFVKEESGYHLRWFTPVLEVDLCGHATLATAFVIFEFIEPSLREVTFNTLSGELVVTKSDDGKLLMDFPASHSKQIDIPEKVFECFDIKPIEAHKCRRMTLVFESEDDIRNLTPNLDRIAEVEGTIALYCTAKGNDVDFVSRVFAPAGGIPEDPVTGSAHCSLVPFWAHRLGKNYLHAKQLSARGGELFCEHNGDRVSIAGYAALYLKGEICF